MRNVKIRTAVYIYIANIIKEINRNIRTDMTYMSLSNWDIPFEERVSHLIKCI